MKTLAAQPYDTPKTLSTLLLGCFLAFILVGYFFLVTFFSNSHRFPIEKVRFQGDFHFISHNELTQVVNQYLDQSFWLINLNELKIKLEQLSWLETVSVSRRWPGSLDIWIKEQEPVALYNESGVMNTKGQIFYPVSLPRHIKLPKFYDTGKLGPVMLSYYQLLLDVLRLTDLRVENFESMADRELKAMLDNKVVIFFGQPSWYQERLKRFKIAYQSGLKAKFNWIKSIDLRYTNGLAVSWKEDIS